MKDYSGYFSTKDILTKALKVFSQLFEVSSDEYTYQTLFIQKEGDMDSTVMLTGVRHISGSFLELSVINKRSEVALDGKFSDNLQGKTADKFKFFLQRYYPLWRIGVYDNRIVLNDASAWYTVGFIRKNGI